MSSPSNFNLTTSRLRPSKIDFFEQDLIRLKQEGYTNQQLFTWVEEQAQGLDQGSKPTMRTLENRLAEWGARHNTSIPITDELAERVNDLFHHTLLNDSQIAARIREDDGYLTTPRQVREIRTLFNWSRYPGPQPSTQGLIYNLLTTGPGRSYGRQWAITYLRHRFGHRARQYDVSNALRLFDPEGVASRLPGMRIKRLENYITAGPDYLWCLDGHDKLAQFGIEIYAAVDAYSRKIIWLYCGLSNRTQLSVLNQYLQAVRARGSCPSYLRTDKGTETVMLADAHFSLYSEAYWREGQRLGWPEDSPLWTTLRIQDCYIYGPSTRNIRVEGLWNQQGLTQTRPWIKYFKLLALTGWYEQNSVADRVVLLFVFMPIIRAELHAFVDTHNAHPIRKQRNRDHHVAGAPNELYRNPTRQCGFALDHDTLNEWESRVNLYGTLSYY